MKAPDEEIWRLYVNLAQALGSLLGVIGDLRARRAEKRTWGLYRDELDEIIQSAEALAADHAQLVKKLGNLATGQNEDE